METTDRLCTGTRGVRCEFFALYKPERIESRGAGDRGRRMVDTFALEPFDGRRYMTETGDDYDFGVPGVLMFVTTDILPGEPGYVENDDFNRRCRRGCGR